MAAGLEGVIVAETTLCHTDRENGMTWVRGHNIPELAERFGFEGTVALIWDGFVANGLTRRDAGALLGHARTEAYARLPLWLPHTLGRPLFEGLRMAIASESDSAAAPDLLSAFAVAVPALVRQARGLPPVPPDPSLTTAADLLRTMHGVPASGGQVAALDVYWAVMAESGMSNSSFAARVVASTRASLAASVLVDLI